MINSYNAACTIRNCYVCELFNFNANKCIKL